MILTNIRIALAALKSAKMRTFLTMTGIIIGVASVSIIMAIGEGLKQQISSESNQFGLDTIEVRPGSLEETDFNNLESINPLRSSSTSTLNENDLGVIQNTDGVEAAAPFMFVAGSAKYKENQVKNPFIVATTEQLPLVIDQNLKAGEFFNSKMQHKVAVIGKNVANQLLNVDDQVGGKITVRGEQFTVIGITESKGSTGIFGGLAPNFNDIIMIPLEAGKGFYGGSAHLQQINIKISKNAAIDKVLASIDSNLLKNHNGEKDFTVATKEEAQEITNSVVKILTIFTAAVASISLLVGGIGIMNIMLVSVTERTREIGIRKSIGATNNQIMSQFLIESIVISVCGGIIGIIIAYIVSGIISIRFDLIPIITPFNLMLSFGVAVGVGILFGTLPAVKAARKDPIKALRYE